MSLKEEVLAKVPKEVQSTPEFKTFLHVIDENNFADVKALKMFVDIKIARAKLALRGQENAPQGQTLRRDQAKQLDFYQTIADKVLKYFE